MGAVFALYSAWYFWIPKILGIDYNKCWGKVHFWVLFLGVNLTFFPQHFLGLQGMPRRISDYPDAFAGWNLISSYGSLVSVIGTFIFLDVLYVQLTKGKESSRYTWLTPQFYTDILRGLLERAYESIEWGLNSPPKPHSFVSLPLQSSYFTSLFRVSTLHNILHPFIVGTLLFILYKYYIEINHPLLCDGGYNGIVTINEVKVDDIHGIDRTTCIGENVKYNTLESYFRSGNYLKGRDLNIKTNTDGSSTFTLGPLILWPNE